MQPGGTDRNLDEDHALQAARESLPDWRLWKSQRSTTSAGMSRGVICAAPKGGIVPLLTADDVDGIVRECRKADRNLMRADQD